MSTPKYTKGPWIYDGKSRDVVRNESGTLICQLYKIHADSLEADARLIASAPEMLELLSKVETHLASGFGNSQEYNTESNKLLDCILVLRERIEGKK